jgi:N utilization substance protein A
MDGEFLETLQVVAREREISTEALLETLQSALITAFKKHDANTGGEIRIKFNTAKGQIKVLSERTVVAGEPEDDTQISLEDAREIQSNLEVGDTLIQDVTPHTFGRIAAQTARQVMLQKLREADREKVYEEYAERVGEVMTGIVQRREMKSILVNIGKIDAVLPPQEQVPTEPYRFNDRIKVYVLEVRRTPKGPQIIVSRTHPSLIRRLFELEVPEIADGVVTIKAVAREPGARSKIAVHSRDEKVDPVGSCVGHRGTRVQAVVNELYDEKIDIVKWSPDLGQFIAEALSPAKVSRVTLNEEQKSAFVIVPDHQLSLAIGKSGQNVRLAARLTGWRIDIRSESQVSRQTLVDATSPEGLHDFGDMNDLGDSAVVAAQPVSESALAAPTADGPAVIDDDEPIFPIASSPIAQPTQAEEGEIIYSLPKSLRSDGG